MIRALLARRSRQSSRAGYSVIQIGLHWLIAALVVLQYATSGAIVRTHSVHLIGQHPSPTDLLLHTLHNRAGLAMIALMGLRLAYRLSIGVPALHGAGGLTAHVARLVHGAFYVVLITEGVTGAIATYFWWPIIFAHVIMFKILLGLIVLHVAAVLWHQLVRRDAVIERMLIPIFMKRTN